MPKEWLQLINEILVMRASRANIVNLVDSFLYKNELSVVMENMMALLRTSSHQI
jgi:hypothetical protein